MKFSVQTTTVWGKKADGSPDYSYAGRVTAYKVVGYSGVGVNFPTESDPTTDAATAAQWCDAANAGQDVPDAKFGSYSDD